MRTLGHILTWVKLGFAVILIVGVVTFFSGGIVKSATTPDSPPTKQEAPWVVQTTSRVYFAKDFSVQAGTPSIRDYWTLDGKHYTLTVGVMPFPKSLFGDVRVYQR